MKSIRIILLLFFVLCSKNLLATAQRGDKLVVNGDTAWIHSFPLEKYLSTKGKRTIGDFDLDKQLTISTALFRGYIATWKLENDSLFLIRIQPTQFSDEEPKELNIQSEFGSDRVFAQWVTTNIIHPQGEILHYSDRDIYEGEKHYTIEQGKLLATEEVNFLEKDNDLLFPGRSFLYDLIGRTILQSITKIERDSIDKNESCNLFISFDENRKISHIGFYRREPENLTEEIILRNAKKALANFPQLMKVNHERYHPPTFDLFFSGHCLKFPYDTDFGCGDEYMIDELHNPEYENWTKMQRWYNRREKEEGLFIIDRHNGDIKGPIFPIWETEFSNENDEFEVTEVDISEKETRETFTDTETGESLIVGSSRRMVISCYECMVKFQETGDRRYTAFAKRLVLRTNKETRELDVYIMLVAPDLAYLEKHLDNPFQYFTYLERDPEFVGIIHFHNLDGEWINGWRRQDGKYFKLLPATR